MSWKETHTNLFSFIIPEKRRHPKQGRPQKPFYKKTDISDALETKQSTYEKPLKCQKKVFNKEIFVT